MDEDNNNIPDNLDKYRSSLLILFQQDDYVSKSLTSVLESDIWKINQFNI